MIVSDVSRKQSPALTDTLLPLPAGVLVSDVCIVTVGAARRGVRPKAMYEAVKSGRIVAYAAPNLGVEPVLLIADVDALVFRPNKRRRGDVR